MLQISVIAVLGLVGFGIWVMSANKSAEAKTATIVRQESDDPTATSATEVMADAKAKAAPNDPNVLIQDVELVSADVPPTRTASHMPRRVIATPRAHMCITCYSLYAAARGHEHGARVWRTMRPHLAGTGGHGPLVNGR